MAENMILSDKPRLAEVLGVDVGEIFSALGRNDLYISADGRVRCDGGNLFMTEYLPDIINHPESIIRAPRLTEAEMAICKAVGAKWVSRDGKSETVDLWKVAPSNGNENLQSNFIGRIYNSTELFPSVHPGDCICAEEAGGDG